MFAVLRDLDQPAGKDYRPALQLGGEHTRNKWPRWFAQATLTPPSSDHFLDTGGIFIKGQRKEGVTYRTAYGTVPINVGDWVILKEDGKFGVFTDAVFNRMYDVVERVPAWL